MPDIVDLEALNFRHKKRAAVIQKILETAKRGRKGGTENGKVSAVGVAYIIEIRVAHAIGNRRGFGTE